ncbi:MAG TPA: MotA/TolQ/ExbB proton channel family protein [Lachnospiraceae bacterium]|nr:MotA/TolQ/ExbB proton channel family protein [Lachnospiraceae bacterium]
MLKLGKSAVVGLIISVGFVVGGVIATGMVGAFWNLPSAFIIVGGTVGSIVIAFPFKRLKTLGPVMKRALLKDNNDTKEDIITLVKLAELSRREGLLSLEEYVDQYTDDDFIKWGVMLIVDGSDEEQLRNLLEGSTYFMKQRHSKGSAMLGMIAATAPALGLLGTYVGLIPMLNSLDDPTILGPMMALELVSSFYGAFIAYVIFSPMSKRLKIMSQEEVSRREILIEGLACIQQGKNPRLIKDELLAFANIPASEFEEQEQDQGFIASEVPNKA